MAVQRMMHGLRFGFATGSLALAMTGYTEGGGIAVIYHGDLARFRPQTHRDHFHGVRHIGRIICIIIGRVA